MKKRTYTDYLFILIIVSIWAIPGFIGIGAFRLYNKYHNQKHSSAIGSVPVKQKATISDEKTLEEFECSEHEDNNKIADTIEQIRDKELAENVPPTPEVSKEQADKPKLEPEPVQEEKPSIIISEKVPGTSKPLSSNNTGGVKTREDFDTEHDQLMAVQMGIMKQLME